MRYCSEGPLAKAGAIGSAAASRACHFIKDNDNQDISLDDLGAAAGVNSSHLCRAFAARFGLPPHAYELQVGVARANARERTRAGRGGHLTGFCDRSHLTRAFGLFRRQLLGDGRPRLARREESKNIQDRSGYAAYAFAWGSRVSAPGPVDRTNGHAKGAQSCGIVRRIAE